MWPLNKTANPPTIATADNFLNWCVTLKDFTGNLGQYLMKKGLLRAFYTICELLWLLKELIRDEENFDVNNPSIILADPELEKALGRRVIFVKEMKSVLLEHVQLAEPGPNYRPTLTFRTYQNIAIVGTPVDYLDKNGARYEAYLFAPDLIQHANYNGPVTIELLKATMPRGFAISFGQQQNTTLCSIQCLKVSISEHELNSFFKLVEEIKNQAKGQILAKNKSLTAALHASSLVKTNYTTSPQDADLKKPKSPSPKLLALLQSFSGQETKKLFTDIEAIDLIVKYIFHKEKKLFLPNCGHIALVEDDPLGEIFQVRAFHRTQLKELVSQQLTIPKEMPTHKKLTPQLSNKSRNFFDADKSKGAPQARKKCFSCKKPCNKSKIFCRLCWQIRKKQVGPQFQTYKSKKLSRPKPPRRIRNPPDAGLCKICFQKEAKTGFLHGKTFHLFGCINCCRAIYLADKPCPICRGKIDKIVFKYDS